MKKLSLIFALILALSLLCGCAGTPVVYYTNCTCPVDSHTQTPVVTDPPILAEGAVKTGVYIGALVNESKSAAGETSGEAKYDVTAVAVTVDAEGVIVSCIIDSVGTSILFDENGVITTDLTAQVLTKNELGENYGMKAYGGAKYEWNEQAAALADYAVGKTVEELKSGAVSESGHAVDADLASVASIKLGGYVAGIEAAVNNAQDLGAQAGDTLKLAVIPSLGESKSADGENAGNAQLDVDVAAVTMNGDVITSCAIDSVQAKVAFGADGVITSDISVPAQSKNALGEAYGMKAYGGAKYEWNEQAASFAAYVTGKTPAEVAGIAVAEEKAADADLAASVTIKIGGFLALIEKAAK